MLFLVCFLAFCFLIYETFKLFHLIPPPSPTALSPLIFNCDALLMRKAGSDNAHCSSFPVPPHVSAGERTFHDYSTTSLAEETACLWLELARESKRGFKSLI